MLERYVLPPVAGGSVRHAFAQRQPVLALPGMDGGPNDDDLLDHVRRAAAETEHSPLRSHDYETWAKANGAPSRSFLYERFQTRWADILTAAGLPALPWRRRLPPDQLREVLAEFATEHPGLQVAAYRQWRSDDPTNRPPEHYINRTYGGWSAALAAAGLEPDRPPKAKRPRRPTIYRHRRYRAQPPAGPR